MNSFQEKFCKYINESQLFGLDDRILLSVSGGVDSCVLCHLFASLPNRWAIAHANFQLRGDESNEDEKFVQGLAHRYQVPFFVKKFSTEQYTQQQQISTQMAARKLRRTWSQKLLDSENYDYIALAHHHNDQLETSLLNFAKGGGIAGLRAMLPKNGAWIRPLLWATKNEIVNYAQHQNLTWREDRTNAEVKYQRNLIRHQVIPVLQKINPSVLATTQQSIARLREVEAIFQAEVRRIGKKVLEKGERSLVIRKGELANHPQAATLLTEWLVPYGFRWSDAQQIALAIRKKVQPGKHFLSRSHKLWFERDKLIVTPIELEHDFKHSIHDEGQKTIIPSGQLTAKKISSEDYQISTNHNQAALDYAQLTFPLELRPWQEGDSFQPLGMTNRKKVSDFLINNKVPSHQKSQVLVLTSNEQIVWVMGYRIDHRFRITPQTDQVYEISWQPR